MTIDLAIVQKYKWKSNLACNIMSMRKFINSINRKEDRYIIK
jgi:hypothetical protein